jgi:phage terminase Nu1 subunit (DNA packaging protein)
MLTAAQLAAALSISERQVQRLAAAGMPVQPIGARGRRYDLEECRQWLRENHACLSNAQKPEAGKSLSASVVNAFTAASRQVQVRVRPSESRLKSDPPSDGSEPRLSLVTPQ